MTILGKHVIMRETLIVIISGREGAMTVVRKPIKRHSDRSEESVTQMKEMETILFIIFFILGEKR